MRCADAAHIVMLKCNCQVTQRRFSIRLGHVRDVIPLDRLHEALGHAIALQAAIDDVQDAQCQLLLLQQMSEIHDRGVFADRSAERQPGELTH